MESDTAVCSLKNRSDNKQTQTREREAQEWQREPLPTPSPAVALWRRPRLSLRSEDFLRLARENVRRDSCLRVCLLLSRLVWFCFVQKCEPFLCWYVELQGKLLNFLRLSCQKFKLLSVTARRRFANSCHSIFGPIRPDSTVAYFHCGGDLISQ